MSGPANPSLVKLDFHPDHVDQLRDFHCGDQPWAMLAAEWIKGPAVWKSINERGSKVWIYTLPTGPIVGFGSLGKTYWTIQPRQAVFDKS